MFSRSVSCKQDCSITQLIISSLLFATKDVDRFNKNEEQQYKIKRTLQYPEAGSYASTIAGHVNLFIFLFESLSPWIVNLRYSSGIFILLISPSVIEINSRTSFFAVSALTCDVSYINQLPTNPPKRVCYIFDWIVKLTDQEEIINWVIDQHCLHDTLREKINRQH
jgi:hypothetical protein